MKKIIILAIVLVFAVVAVFALPAHAGPKPKDVNATVVNEPTVHVGSMPEGCCGDTGSASTVYQFAAYSTTTTDGDARGTGGMNLICKTDLGNPAARMCTTQEVRLSPNFPPLSGGGTIRAWIHPTPATSSTVNNEVYVLDAAGFGIKWDPSDTFENTANCTGWTNNGIDRGGTVFIAGVNGTEMRVQQLCWDSTIRVVCCIPAN